MNSSRKTIWLTLYLNPLQATTFSLLKAIREITTLQNIFSLTLFGSHSAVFCFTRFFYLSRAPGQISYSNSTCHKVLFKWLLQFVIDLRVDEFCIKKWAGVTLKMTVNSWVNEERMESTESKKQKVLPPDGAGRIDEKFPKPKSFLWCSGIYLAPHFIKHVRRT